MPSDESVFVLVESSQAGDCVLGVFSTLTAARTAIPVSEVERLKDYRIEVHMLDEAPAAIRPWMVVMNEEGAVSDASLMIACSCCDEEEAFATASYIDVRGERLHQLVWHVSAGRAIDVADQRRQQLLKDGLWRAGVILTPMEPQLIR